MRLPRLHTLPANGSPARFATLFVASMLLLALTACSGGSPVSPDGARESADSLGRTILDIPVDTSMPGPNDITPGQILVKFRDSASKSGVANLHARLGGTYLSTIGGINVQVIAVPVGQERAFISRYAAEKTVEFAEPDLIMKAFLTPNDTSFGSQWGMTKIQAPTAWNVTTGLATVKVAVLDTGIDTAHTDVYSKVVLAKNFTSSTTTAFQDGHGHGTHCSGIVAAVTNNAKGVAGVGFNTSLLIGKVLSDSGSGSTSWIASGINWASTNGAKVISLSLGGGSSSTMSNAVNAAWNNGVVVVAAAGNSNSSTPSYPGAYTNSISVASTTSSDQRSSFSNWGSTVDVSAPGSSILSTYKGNAYAYMSGTSMACPHVAGLAALVWAVPAYGTSNTAVRNRIQTTTDPISSPGKPIGTGRINAARAVGAI